jgi:aminodeoxyfutalosine synthase
MEAVTALAGIAERVSRGQAIDAAEAELILRSHDLITIASMADAVRRTLRGTDTTFVRVFEVHVEAPPSTRPPGLAAGEVRIVGLPQSIEQAVSAVQSACAVAGGIPVTGFSLADLVVLASSIQVPLGDVLGHLREAGLHAIAEVPLDLLPEPTAPVETARTSGLVANRLTVHTLAAEARLSIVARARDLQRACGGFRAFAPLPRSMSVATPTTGYDDVKQVAIARVMVTAIPSIQVDWPLYGPKLAQVALTMGADDVDGVAAIDAGVLGTRRTAIEEIKGNIRAAALNPVERNGRFEVMG